MKCVTTKADETPEFVEFWDWWRPMARKTDGRGDARDAFFKHVRAGADPRDLVDGARWFLRTMKDERQYVPMASVWLNRRAYEDQAEQERDHQRRIEEHNKQRASEQQNVVRMQPAKTRFLQQWEGGKERQA